MSGKAVEFEKLQKTTEFRNSFVQNLLEKFPNSIDLEETFTIVQNLKEQAIKVDTKYEGER